MKILDYNFNPLAVVKNNKNINNNTSKESQCQDVLSISQCLQDSDYNIALDVGNNKKAHIQLKNGNLFASLVDIDNNVTTKIESHNIPKDLHAIKDTKTLDAYLKNVHANVSILSDGSVKLYVEQNLNGGMWRTIFSTAMTTHQITTPPGENPLIRVVLKPEDLPQRFDAALNTARELARQHGELMRDNPYLDPNAMR